MVTYVRVRGEERESVCVCVDGWNDIERVSNENKMKEKGKNANAEPVALVALPGETLWWPPICGAACGFLYHSVYIQSS